MTRHGTSHKELGIVGVYNKAQHLPERRKIMQAWADYLDMLKVGGSSRQGVAER